MLSENTIEKSGIFDSKKVSLLKKKILSGKSISEVDGMALTGIISSMLVHSQFIRNFKRANTKPVSIKVFVDRRSA